MILFVGDGSQGFFLEDILSDIEETISYTGLVPYIAEAKQLMAQEKFNYIVVDITQFVDSCSDICAELNNIKMSMSIPIIIFAPGLQLQSEILISLNNIGLSLFITAVTPSKQREQFHTCLTRPNTPLNEINGFTESQIKKREPPIVRQKNYKTISLCGACERIGTTTQAIQIIKYLQFNGYKAAYIEMNSTKFVLKLGTLYEEAVFDKTECTKITYKNIDFYYLQEELSDILKKKYDYFVFDYGSANDQYFNAISFIEKDIPIIVCGSSPSEWDSTNAVIAKMLLHDAYYIFNFCDKSEHQEILDLMQEKAKKTIFSDYAPDFSLFTADRNNLYKQIIKLENLSVSKPAKKGLFNWKRNKSYGKV